MRLISKKTFPGVFAGKPLPVTVIEVPPGPPVGLKVMLGPDVETPGKVDNGILRSQASQAATCA